ncbi:MAG: DNA-processing protein DprA [Qipengyuania citrea]
MTDVQRLAWLQLIRSENIGATTFIELIKRFGTATRALQELPDLVARSGRKPIKVTSPAEAERELEKIYTLGARLVCLGEPGYPAALRAAEAPPPVLTVFGNCDALGRNAIAFVGSRNASLAGVKLTGQLVNGVAAGGYVIVSGLARGIDAAAHKASLSSGTIAVFAGGVDQIYPEQNIPLARAIIDKGGAVVSEMPFAWQPRAKDFPRRNRIVAGLALGLVVVEAARRSGSLISARLANEMGRLVFAVPGSPMDPRSEGTNALIRQGAQLITCSEDILGSVNPIATQPQQAAYSLEDVRQIDMASVSKSPPPDDQQRSLLLDAMGYTPASIDDLLRHTGLDADTVQMILLELSLVGEIERHAGNRVSRR